MHYVLCMNFVFSCVLIWVCVCVSGEVLTAALWPGERNVKSISSNLLDRNYFLMDLFCSGRIHSLGLVFTCGDLRCCVQERKQPLSKTRPDDVWYQESHSVMGMMAGPVRQAFRQGCWAAVWASCCLPSGWTSNSLRSQNVWVWVLVVTKGYISTMF